MKKLSVLVALALCVIIGGVYAAWIYAGTTLNPITGQTITMQMGEDDFTDAAGSYTVENNTLMIKVEPKEGTYNTSLVITGSATLVFTAWDNTISDASLADALGGRFEIHCPNNASVQYGGQSIFTLKNEGKKTLTAGDWHKDSATRYTLTIDEAFIKALIDINEFTLDQHTEYVAFEHELLQLGIHFAVYPNGYVEP